VPHKYIGRVALVAILCLALAKPARANFQTQGEEILAGIIVVTAAIAVLVTVLILHHKGHKSEITGCVSSGANGMTLTDEIDKRTYTLSGDTSAVKTGDRVTLEGKRKTKGDTFIFQAHKVNRDFGACRP
jgi:hypothetical protein